VTVIGKRIPKVRDSASEMVRAIGREVRGSIFPGGLRYYVLTKDPLNIGKTDLGRGAAMRPPGPDTLYISRSLGRSEKLD
jgi:hypothetical protein